MADYPRVPRRFVTTDTPQSSLTRADIEAPYASLARGLNDTGKALSDIAEPIAEEAGLRGVSIDAEGNPTVSRLPFVGAAATAQERGLKVGALAEADREASRKLIELRDDFRNDPGGYIKAADAFRTEHKSKWETAVGPQVGVALDRSMQSTALQVWRGLHSEHERLALQRSHDQIDARLTGLADDLEVLARNGGVSTPEYKERLGNLDALLAEKVGNPLFHFPQERADLVRDNVLTRAHGASVLNQVERVYGERGYEAARTYLRDTVRDLGVTLKQGDKIERAGMAWLRSEEVGFRADRDVISREWPELKKQAATLPRESLAEFHDRALAVGNHRVAQDVAAHMRALDLVSDLRALPASDKALVAVTGKLPANLSAGQSQVRQTIETEARRQGVDPRLATAVAVAESSLNPEAASKTSSARGVFQLIQANRQQFGVADNATPEEQVRGGVSFLKSTIDGLRTQLGREPTAAETYITYFQGAGAGPAIIRAAPDASLKDTLDKVQPGLGDKVLAANPWLKDTPTVGAFREWAERKMGGGGGADLTQNRAGQLALGMMKKDMAGDITREIGDLRDKVKKEEFPPIDQVVALGEKVYAIGTDVQKREVSELVAIAKVGQTFSQLPAAQRAQAISEADADLKTASPRFESRLRDSLRSADKMITGAFKEDPYGAFVRFNRGEAAKPTPAMDMANPAQMGAVAEFRVKQQGVMREAEGLGPVSIFRPAESEAFRNTMASSDAKGAAGLMTFLNRLPDDVLGATLADEKVKTALAAGTRSTDPAKYTAVMTGLDHIYARDPHRFTNLFGADAWHALADWQNTLRYISPDQLAAERAAINDPSQAKARKEVMEQGHKIANGMTPEQVVKTFDTSFGVTPGFIARNVTGTQPLAPVDSGTTDALMGDFDTVFARRYATSRDKDTAAKETAEYLKTKWKRSEVNEGRLMRNAPEQVYPAIDGGFDWMKPQLETDLTQRLGMPRHTPVGPGLGDAFRALNPIEAGMRAAAPSKFGFTNWDYAIVPDRQTETETQRYDRAQPISDTNRPPTYQIVVRDNRRENPQWDVIRSGDGRALRYGFDPDIARAEDRVKFGTTRQREEDFLARKDVEAARARRAAEGQ